MTDDVFEDLVNLYLDKEINPVQLKILRDELDRNPSRRKVFESYCRMHQATHFAALSACPVIPKLDRAHQGSEGKPALFAFNRQVWAAVLLIAVLGTFATVYMNGPFGSARIVQDNKLEKIETFVQTKTQPTQPPLEFFKALKAQNQSRNWSYIQELRHVRVVNQLDTEERPSTYTLYQMFPEAGPSPEMNQGFDLEYSSFEFKR